MGAYEHLWSQPSATFKRIADLFRQHEGSLPKDHVTREDAEEARDRVLAIAREEGVMPFGVRVNGAAQYPSRLRDAAHPVELLYYRGYWEVAENEKAIAVVGSRKASRAGLEDAARVAEGLVEHGYTVVSGLAAGIDTAALISAIRSNGRVIAVIGTPITDYYPRENRDLQNLIAKDHLLVSQVPVLRYRSQDWRTNRFFFPERNKTMSALTKATVIVEAGESSGTLVQARAALQQGRTLFIMKRCFDNKRITWPEKFRQKGAIIVESMDDIKWGLDGV